MSDKSKTDLGAAFDRAEEQTQTSATATATAAPKSEQARPEANLHNTATKSPTSFNRVMTDLGISNVQLSPEGDAYIETLTKKLSESQIKIERINHNRLPIFRVIDPSATYVTLLILEENYLVSEHPAVKIIEDDVIRKEKYNVIDTPTVTREDYAYVNHMASHIERTYKYIAYVNSSSININSFSDKKLKFRVSTNIKEVEDIVRRQTPHASMPRMDYGFVLKMHDSSDDHYHTNYSDQVFDPILAVGAYTKFVQQNEHGKFFPVVAITAIASTLPDPGIMSLALPLAADAFIRRRHWLNPYMSFTKDSPNIGDLVTDTKTNKKTKITTRAGVEEFVQLFCDTPYLCVDTTDGRARIPGLEQIAYNINDYARRLFDFVGDTQNANIAAEKVRAERANKQPIRDGAYSLQDYYEYTGIIDGALDSRVVDYLYLTKKGLNDPDKLIKFVIQHQDAGHKQQVLSSITTNYRCTYRNISTILNPAFVLSFVDKVVNVIKPVWPGETHYDNNLQGLMPGANEGYNNMPIVRQMPNNAGFINQNFNGIYSQVY